MRCPARRAPTAKSVTSWNSPWKLYGQTRLSFVIYRQVFLTYGNGIWTNTLRPLLKLFLRSHRVQLSSQRLLNELVSKPGVRQRPCRCNQYAAKLVILIQRALSERTFFFYSFSLSCFATHHSNPAPFHLVFDLINLKSDVLKPFSTPVGICCLALP